MTTTSMRDQVQMKDSARTTVRRFQSGRARDAAYLSWLGFLFLSFNPHSQGEELGFEALEAYRRAYVATETAWSALAARVVARFPPLELPQSALETIDPWASMESECGYVPELREFARTEGDFTDILRPLSEMNVGVWIPSEYRLAEALGLGTNRIRWDGDFIDPNISMLNRRDETLVILARARHWFIGEFFMEDGGASPQLETFRRTIDGTSWIESGLIAVAPAARIDHRRIENYTFRRGYQTGAHARTSWARERLFRRLELLSRELTPSKSDKQAAQDSVQKFRSALEGKIHELRLAVTQEALGLLNDDLDLENRSELEIALDNLDEGKLGLRAAFAKVGHSRAQCALWDFEDLPDRDSVYSRLNRSVPNERPVFPIDDMEDRLQGIKIHWRRHRSVENGSAQE